MDITTYLLKASILLAAVLALVAVLGRTNPRWRMLLCELVAVGVLLLPLLALLPIRIDLPLDMGETTASANGPAVGALDEEGTHAESLSESGGVFLAAGERGSDPAAPGLSSGLAMPTVRSVLLATYLAGVLILLLRYFFAARALRRTVAGLEPAARSEQALLDELAEAMRVGATPRLLISDEAVSPMVTGLRRAAVVIPRCLTRPDQSMALRMALRHELHHLQNRDLHRALLFQALTLVLWFHPFAWFVRRSHAVAGEELCDRVASEDSGATSYRASIARLALDLRPQPTAAVAIGMFHSSRIVARLNRLKRPVPHTRLGSKGWAGALAATMLMLVVSSMGVAKPKLNTGPIIAGLPKEKIELARNTAKRALTYLVSKQHKDGSLAFEANEQRSKQTAITALAGMAFYRHGGANPKSPYYQPMLRCLDYVLTAQNKKGYFLGRAGGGPDSMYTHCIATAFLAEAGRQAKDKPDLVEGALNRAVKVILDAQRVPKKKAHHKGGWRYTPTSTTSDISVSAWAMQALYAAKEAGTDIPEQALKDGVTYVLGMQSDKGGGFGYVSAGHPNGIRTGMALYVLAKGGLGNSQQATKAADYMRAAGGASMQQYPYYSAMWCTSALAERGGDEAARYAANMIDFFNKSQQEDGSFPQKSMASTVSAALALAPVAPPR